MLSWFCSLFLSAKNVLLTEEYTRAKLADFDSAKRLSDEFTEAGLQPLGTKGFASPEVSMLINFSKFSFCCWCNILSF